MDKNFNCSSIDYLVSNDVQIHDATQIATILNDYFINVVSELNSVIPETPIDPISYINVTLNSTLNNFDHCTHTKFLLF